MSMPERRTLMRTIVSQSLRFRVIVVASAVAMMVFGVVQLPAMRVDVFPEFAPPQVEIQTICLGLSTADVESLVTVPLEQALNGVKGLDDLRSKSVPQLSSIQLIFKPGVDLLEARQLVQERLALVTPSLPTWAAPPVMLPPLSATSRAVQIGMTVEGPLADRHVDDGVLDHQGAPAARPRRRERGHLGRAAADDASPGRPRQDGGKERQP